MKGIMSFRERKLFGRNTGAARLLKGAALCVFAVALIFLLKGAKYALLVLGAAAVHEVGHLIFAKLLRVPLVKVRGRAFGMWLGYDFSGKSYLVQITVSCAGAFFNVVCALTVLICTRVSYETVFFAFSNLALALFNLMPVSRFDGIGVLRCLVLTLTQDLYKAERLCKTVSAVFSFVFFLFTVYVQLRVGINMPMLIISVLLLCGCTGMEADEGL